MRIHGQDFEAVAHLEKRATARLMAVQIRRWLHLPVRVVPKHGQYALMVPAKLNSTLREALDRVGR